MSTMSSTQEPTKAPKPMDEKTVKVNRLKLIAIFGVAVIPVVVAFIMYFGGVAVPSAKTNKGNLILPPVDLALLNSQAVLSNQLSIKESILASGKWTLMLTGGNACDQACKDLIHTVRQVNVSMAKEMDRVSRVMVSGLGASELATIEADYPQMVLHSADAAALEAFQNAAAKGGGTLPQTGTTPWRVWLVDPLGNVIMQYTEANDGYDMIGDLKRVLKLSNIG